MFRYAELLSRDLSAIYFSYVNRGSMLSCGRLLLILVALSVVAVDEFCERGRMSDAPSIICSEGGVATGCAGGKLRRLNRTKSNILQFKSVHNQL